MSQTRRTIDPAATVRQLALGAAVAIVLGTSAGAALKPQRVEWHQPAAPQQIFAPDERLSTLEAQGGGWPARAHS